MFCHLFETYNNDFTKKKENVIKYSIYKFLLYLCSHIGTKYLYLKILNINNQLWELKEKIFTIKYKKTPTWRNKI